MNATHETLMGGGVISQSHEVALVMPFLCELGLGYRKTVTSYSGAFL